MWFVGIVASFVNGAYPEHYDLKLQKRVRRVLTFGIVSMSSIEIVTEEQILQVPMFAHDTTISEQIYLLFVFLYLFPIIYLSFMRLSSIEEHILKTSAEEVRYQSSNEAVVDTNLLYDYLKVFVTLMIVFSIPDLISPLEIEFVQVLSTGMFPIQLYYFLIIMEYSVSIGGRWSRKYMSNDSSEKTALESKTN